MQRFQSPITPPKIIEPERNKFNAQLGIAILQSFNKIRPRAMEKLCGQAKSGQTDAAHESKMSHQAYILGRQ